MNVNIYINDDLAKQLDYVMLSTHKKRNTLIQEAIADLIQNYKAQQWPESILKFKGIDGMSAWEGFEEHRKELKEPNLDIF